MNETLEFAHDYYVVEFVDAKAGAVIQRSNPLKDAAHVATFMHTLIRAGFIVLRIHGVSK